MKIALIRQKYTPFGGAERYMARLVDGLVAEGHEVHILAAKWDAGGEAAVIFHRVPILKPPGWLKALTFSLGCKRILKSQRFDVVFSLERTLRQDVYRAGDGCHRQWLKQKLLGKGLLSRMATYLNPVQLAYLHLERKLFTDARLSAIIANSQMGKAEIMSFYGVPPEKIHVVYNGIDAAAFPLDQRERYRERLAGEYGLSDELRILYVGSGFKRKGVPALIEAVQQLKVPFRLFVVGKGRTGALERRVRRLGLSGKVIFTGPVREVERFYLGCDLFAFPTLYDPFSNATLEAMACGLPVVTSRFNGVAELIQDGESGFLLRDPLDAGEIAGSISRLIEAEPRREMGRRGQLAVQGLTMVRNTRESLAVIDQVLNGEARAGMARSA